LSKKSNPDKNSPLIFNPIISQNYKNILFLEFSWKNNQLATSRILAILEFSPPFSKSIKIVERIDSLLPKTSNNQNITHGEVIQALVMQGLGFSNHRLYLSAEFFSHVAMNSLFNSKIKSEHFTPDTIGRRV
jgi:hypothetical protein